MLSQTDRRMIETLDADVRPFRLGHNNSWYPNFCQRKKSF